MTMYEELIKKLRNRRICVQTGGDLEQDYPLMCEAAEGATDMSVYIKGVEMPKEGFVELLIRADGTVQQTGQSYRLDGKDYYTVWAGEVHPSYEAIPVPDHERLGDLDAVVEKFNAICDRRDAGIISDLTCMNMLLQAVTDAPTIIPASKEGK